MAPFFIEYRLGELGNEEDALNENGQPTSPWLVESNSMRFSTENKAHFFKLVHEPGCSMGQ